MKWAHVVNNAIDTISYEPVEGWVVVGDDVFAGFVLVGSKWQAPERPAEHLPVPEELSRWQFFSVAVLAGKITWAEAEAALTGDLPALFLGFIATMAPEEQPVARMLLKGNQVFHRHHQFVQAFLAANGMTDEQADAIWRAGAALGAV